MISNFCEEDECAEQSAVEETKVCDTTVTTSPSRRSNSIPNASYPLEGTSSLSFPLQMMDILSNEDPSIIRWLPHGKGFIVADKKRFAAEVMPKYFSRASKYTSFTRKLNRWYVTVIVEIHGP